MSELGVKSTKNSGLAANRSRMHIMHFYLVSLGVLETWLPELELRSLSPLEPSISVLASFEIS